MSVTIYHNPRCSKSRETLKILQGKSLDLTIVEYLKEPLDRAQLIDLINKLGIDPSQLMRQKECKELDIITSSLDITEQINTIAQNPKVMERPVVTSPKGARICRPPEIVHEIL